MKGTFHNMNCFMDKNRTNSHHKKIDKPQKNNIDYNTNIKENSRKNKGHGKNYQRLQSSLG